MTPDRAREQWEELLRIQQGNPALEWALRCILESVMVDHITNRMAKDDEFAVVIGRRMAELKRVIGEASQP